LDQATGAGAYDPATMARAAALQNLKTNEARFNVTVNGAIDPESTARQIVSILNDSTARGTLGAGAFDR